MEEAIPGLISAIPDLVRDWELKAVVNDACTIETSHFSDAAKGIRRKRVEERWEEQRELGFGSFGVVHLQKCASGPRSGSLRAVKRIRIRPALLSETEVKVLSRELSAIVKFSHAQYRDCFVRSFGWFYAQSSIFITMEYLALGDLESRIRNPVPDSEAQRICQQVLQGLVFMHRNNFAHRDLKPSNILVQHKGPNWWVKLSDFGTSKQIGSTALRTITGTEQYLAPELQNIYTLSDLDLVRDGTYSLAVDIWAIGAIAFRLTTGKLPFQEPTSLYQYVQLGDPLPRDELQTVECTNFVASTMNGSPRKRLTADEALESPWIEKAPSTFQTEISETSTETEPMAPLRDNATTTTYSNSWSTIQPVSQGETSPSEINAPEPILSEATIRRLAPPVPPHQSTNESAQSRQEQPLQTGIHDPSETPLQGEIKELQGFATWLTGTSIRFSADGKWLAGCFMELSPVENLSARVRIWQLQTPLQYDNFQDIGGYNIIDWFSFAWNGEYVIIRGQLYEKPGRFGLSVWRLNTQDGRFVKVGQDDEIVRRTSMDMRSRSQASVDGEMVIQCITGSRSLTYEVVIWKLCHPNHSAGCYRKIQTFAETGEIWNVYSWSPDGQAFLEMPGPRNKETDVRLWKRGKDDRFYLALKVLVRYPSDPTPDYAYMDARISPDGRWAVIWHPGRERNDLLKVIEIGKREMWGMDLTHPMLRGANTTDVAWSPDSRIMAMSCHLQEVMMWKLDAEDNFIPITTPRMYGMSNCLTFSPDGKVLVGADYFSMHLWKIA